MVRRRRDQAHAGHGVTHPRDDFIHLVAGQLAAFTGLRSLRHLDLQIVGVDEIMRGHAETPRRNLLDGTAPQVSVRIGFETLFVFAALARVGAAADAVHGDRQRLVRFFGYRAERHRAGGESLDDFARGLHFFDRHGRSGLELEQAAQRAEMAALLVDQVGVFLKSREVILPHRVLHFAYGRRIDQVILAAHPPGVAASDRKFGVGIFEAAGTPARASSRLRAPGRRARRPRSATRFP